MRSSGHTARRSTAHKTCDVEAPTRAPPCSTSVVPCTSAASGSAANTRLHAAYTALASEPPYLASTSLHAAPFARNSLHCAARCRRAGCADLPACVGHAAPFARFELHCSLGAARPRSHLPPGAAPLGAHTHPLEPYHLVHTPAHSPLEAVPLGARGALVVAAQQVHPPRLRQLHVQQQRQQLQPPRAPVHKVTCGRDRRARAGACGRVCVCVFMRMYIHMLRVRAWKEAHEAAGRARAPRAQ